jgi:hypothetical protein
MSLVKELKEALLKNFIARFEAYRKTLPTCNMFGCGEPAVKNKKYCLRDMLYCNYCRSDEVVLQSDGHEICSECCWKGDRKGKPKYRFDGTLNENNL